MLSEVQPGSGRPVNLSTHVAQVIPRLVVRMQEHPASFLSLLSSQVIVTYGHGDVVCVARKMHHHGIYLSWKKDRLPLWKRS